MVVFRVQCIATDPEMEKRVNGRLFRFINGLPLEAYGQTIAMIVAGWNPLMDGIPDSCVPEHISIRQSVVKCLPPALLVAAVYHDGNSADLVIETADAEAPAQH